MDLKFFLEEKVKKYNNPSFIVKDPISIPHRYSKKQDIEISAFLSSILAWGKRDVILKKATSLLKSMGRSPHEFVLNFTQDDLYDFVDFKHRTFHSTDLFYCFKFLQYYYRNNDSLESAFLKTINTNDDNVGNGLIGFSNLFFSLGGAPKTTFQHVPNPLNKSACKRLNMFLRWMVRKDDKGVDFGIWDNIKSSQLIIPCDVHVYIVSKKLGLLSRNSLDWKAALEITKKLKELDPDDPVKYDFALFSIGADKLG